MPAAFQRTPPISQTDRECPQGQVHIHSRDSASIDFAEASGNTASKSFWINDINPFYLFAIPVRKPVLKHGYDGAPPRSISDGLSKPASARDGLRRGESQDPKPKEEGK